VQGIATGEGNQGMGRGGAEGAVTRGKFGKGRGDESELLIGLPLSAVDHPGALVGAAPGENLLALIEIAYGTGRADKVVGPLGVPGDDDGVEHRPRDCHVHANVLVDTV